MKEVELVIVKGEIIVNGAYTEDNDVKIIHVDLTSKYADAMAMGMTLDRIPEILLFATPGGTLFTDESKKGQSTVLTFPEYKGWEATTCWVGRYTLSIVLRRIDECSKVN